MKRYNMDDLIGQYSKKDLIDGLNLKVFDYALPQMWLDYFVKNTGLDYNLVLSNTVWCYDNSLFGYPVSACIEVQDEIDKYLKR